MTLTLQRIEQMAPGQDSLKAASKLRKPGLWPLRARDAESGMIWGECQGSASAPYRLSLVLEDFGHRCSCPSRKFPCKHVLALAWLYVEHPEDFAAAEPPDWVRDWLARRRPGAAKVKSQAGGSAAAAAKEQAEPVLERDPKAEARAAEQRERLRAAREESIASGLDELDRWIRDQLDRGVAGFPAAVSEQCRIASQRLVDAKAPGLATLIDALATELFGIADAERHRFILERLGQLYMIGQAYRRQDRLSEFLRADVRRAVGWTQTRDEILADPASLKVDALWRVLGTLTEVQSDKLRRLETWLIRLDGEGPDFALLLDFVPASSGVSAPPFTPGECFRGALAFFPSAAPLRAVIAERRPGVPAPIAPVARRNLSAALDAYEEALRHLPWMQRWPVAFADAVVAREAERYVLTDAALAQALPIDATQVEELPPLVGVSPITAIALWNGRSAHLLAAETPLGDWSAA